LVYVANDGDATHSANYTGFFLTGFGRLVPLPRSTVNAPGAANDLGDVLFNSTGTAPQSRKLLPRESGSAASGAASRGASSRIGPSERCGMGRRLTCESPVARPFLP
jgi:hypothetical protein